MSDISKSLTNPPKTPDIKKWEKYLDRKLKKKEKELLENVEDEYNMNKGIKLILKKFKNESIYIPRLSVTDGNCFYDSISYHLPDTNKNELRKLISNFMRIYKNYKGIFKSSNFSLNEMFEFQNEIEYLQNKKNNTTYKYTFDIMCSDLECDCSWKRLPMEIILMCVSYIFDSTIIIFHDNGHKTEICSIEEPIKNIYIGLLGEAHYIPIDKINDSKPTKIIYNDYDEEYKKWIEKVTL